MIGKLVEPVLYWISPRSGRPCKLLKDIKQYVIGLIKESPRALKTGLAQLSKKQGITVSCATLKRLCKQAKQCWKRVGQEIIKSQT
jgi:hypothetical protein